MVSAIVLAAGLSQRMGGINKLLLPYKEGTVISGIVENIRNAGIEDIIVVTGFEEDKIKKALQNFPVQIVFNSEYKNGMTATVQKGVEAANGIGYMICLGDMVAITSGEYAFIAAYFENNIKINTNCIVVPVYKRQQGNPVLFSSHYREQILQHKEMNGCRQIVQSNKTKVLYLDMPLDTILRDIDFYDDYRQEVTNHQ